MTIKSDRILDVVGVGLGPFNLSTAALLDPFPEITACFFEREKEFQWHPGLLFPEATIQVSFLKDLVTLADPTSRYSFLAFLFANRRLYRFINANFARVTRVEFNQYFRWVANQLPALEFGSEVKEISCNDESFIVSAGNRSVTARNIILGTGLQPMLPDCTVPHLGPTVLHASKYLMQKPNTGQKRVAVIGGGQTGAEIVCNLLSREEMRPEMLYWISRRPNFLPLDDSPFTNELFTPNYSDYFYGLSSQDRLSILAEQKLASDGISNSLLERIYQLLYEAEFLKGQGRSCVLHPRYELTGMKSSHRNGWTLTLYNLMNGSLLPLEVDVIILATGSVFNPLPALQPILHLFHRDGKDFVIKEDYSVGWDGPESLKVYLQNGARHCRGVADPNLSLMAWRSARIINSVMGRCVYDIAESASAFEAARTPLNERSLENDLQHFNEFSKAELFAHRNIARRHAGI
ncbi:MAG TPA: SidA/IucD/PvdA family monooxygenase [Candidatus Dormibacteraeota bacterium]|jgi:lysine N6-hydroxylase|nr:SidA/IucD/PvdA family monooxygenase [Candidatus Dormibacteraeota bacterium]